MPILILLLIVGTLAQKTMGLYVATSQFFLSPIMMIGGIPVPGMPFFLGVLALNILAHLVLKTPLRLSKVGLLLTHLGVAILIIGSLFVSTLTQEGYIDLAEGERASLISDYHIRVLTLRSKSAEHQYHYPFNDLEVGRNVTLGPFTLSALELCDHCKVSKRIDGDERYVGMARQMQLNPQAPALKNEENMAGMTFEYEGEIHTILEHVAVSPSFVHEGVPYQIFIEKQMYKLPFSIELVDFEKTSYPGTTQASAYQSTVRILEEGSETGLWQAVIAMNQPLRYQGYSFFQSSFARTDQGERSVLAVVYNPVRSLPYLAGLIICLGMLWHVLAHYAARVKRVGVVFIVIAGLLAGAGSPALADGDVFEPDLQSFSMIPVLHEGRFKPMESFARAVISDVSGSERNALQTLVTLLFDFDQGADILVLKITHPDVKNLLRLEGRKDGLYSYRSVFQALSDHRDLIRDLLETEPDRLTSGQKDLLEVYRKSDMVRNLLGGLSLLYPIQGYSLGDLPPSLSGRIDGPATEWLSFYNTTALHQEADRQIKALITDKGTDLGQFTQADHALTLYHYALDTMRKRAANVSMPKLIQGVRADVYHSVPDILLQGAGGGVGTGEQLDAWSDLVASYAARDIKGWMEASTVLAGYTPDHTRFTVERAYHVINPYQVSLWLFMAALIVLLVAFVRYPALFPYAALPLSAGMLALAAGVATRIYVMARPPVGTLYESILFTALIVVLAGLIQWARHRDAIWLWIGSGAGMTLLLLADANHQSGDNMTVLSAVLNTNFWLTTHVLTITAGYGFCLLVSGLAHIILLRRAYDDEGLLLSLRKTALIALFLTTLGTILGGVWADQSWGRFWGWDPKENGALLIIFWLIWFLHGWVSRSMSASVTIAGMAYLSVIVGLSWFGVNLLNIGLHSYGFTDLMRWTLLVFTVFETALIAALFLRGPKPVR